MRFSGLSASTFALLASGAAAQDEVAHKYARGYKRISGSSNGIEVATITEEMIRDAPDAIDWSEKGATTPIKDQGQCGSCWAFSTTEGVESAYYMANGKLPEPLSTQQVISCDKTDGGCNGGDLPSAFHYLMKAGGQDTDADYPDTSHTTGNTGKCKWDKKEVVKVSHFRYAVPPCSEGSCTNQDEEKLAAALAKYGPLSICLNAEVWDDYSGGIFKKKCSSAASAMDHCVQLVGYDKTQKYWKVRNSWTKSWGEEGFIRLPMGDNACGVANEAVIVSIEKDSDIVV